MEEEIIFSESFRLLVATVFAFVSNADHVSSTHLCSLHMVYTVCYSVCNFSIKTPLNYKWYSQFTSPMKPLSNLAG